MKMFWKEKKKRNNLRRLVLSNHLRDAAVQPAEGDRYFHFLVLQNKARKWFAAEGRASESQTAVGFVGFDSDRMEFSEHIKTANVEDVVLRQPLHPPIRGTLCITGHHLLFSDREEDQGRSSGQVLLLLRNIDAVEKRWGS